MERQRQRETDTETDTIERKGEGVFYFVYGRHVQVGPGGGLISFYGPVWTKILDNGEVDFVPRVSKMPCVFHVCGAVLRSVVFCWHGIEWHCFTRLDGNFHGLALYLTVPASVQQPWSTSM